MQKHGLPYCLACTDCKGESCMNAPKNDDTLENWFLFYTVCNQNKCLCFKTIVLCIIHLSVHTLNIIIFPIFSDFSSKIYILPKFSNSPSYFIDRSFWRYSWNGITNLYWIYLIYLYGKWSISVFPIFSDFSSKTYTLSQIFPVYVHISLTDLFI